MINWLDRNIWAICAWCAGINAVLAAVNWYFYISLDLVMSAAVACANTTIAAYCAFNCVRYRWMRKC